jgi:hypothetical protein
VLALLSHTSATWIRTFCDGQYAGSPECDENRSTKSVKPECQGNCAARSHIRWSVPSFQQVCKLICWAASGNHRETARKRVRAVHSTATIPRVKHGVSDGLRSWVTQQLQITFLRPSVRILTDTSLLFFGVVGNAAGCVTTDYPTWSASDEDAWGRTSSTVCFHVVVIN